jgi:hypothetical protein
MYGTYEARSGGAMGAARGWVVRPLVGSVAGGGGRPLPQPAHDAAYVRYPLAPARRPPRDALARDGAREHPHDFRPLRAPGHLRRGRRHRPHGGGCEMSPHRDAQNSWKSKSEGAERTRTAVRGFAGPCLTSRPPRQRAFHGIRLSGKLERRERACAECWLVGWRGPCPGVDGASSRLEPRPPTGAPLLDHTGRQRLRRAKPGSAAASRRSRQHSCTRGRSPCLFRTASRPLGVTVLRAPSQCA